MIYLACTAYICPLHEELSLRLSMARMLIWGGIAVHRSRAVAECVAWHAGWLWASFLHCSYHVLRGWGHHHCYRSVSAIVVIHT